MTFASIHPVRNLISNGASRALSAQEVTQLYNSTR